MPFTHRSKENPSTTRCYACQVERPFSEFRYCEVKPPAPKRSKWKVNRWMKTLFNTESERREGEAGEYRYRCIDPSNGPCPKTLQKPQAQDSPHQTPRQPHSHVAYPPLKTQQYGAAVHQPVTVQQTAALKQTAALQQTATLQPAATLQQAASLQQAAALQRQKPAEAVLRERERQEELERGRQEHLRERQELQAQRAAAQRALAQVQREDRIAREKDIAMYTRSGFPVYRWNPKSEVERMRDLDLC